MDDRGAEQDDHGEGVTFGLVMPFTVVESTGGPYDDQSFVAGYQCGDLAMKLHFWPHGPSGLDATVYSGLVPQLDLIAMKEGWTMTAEDSGTEGWTYVHFDKVGHGG